MNDDLYELLLYDLKPHNVYNMLDAAAKSLREHYKTTGSSMFNPLQRALIAARDTLPLKTE